MRFLKKIGLVRLVISVALIALLGSFIFRKQIREHRVTKAKVEMFKRMSDSKPEVWGKEFRQIYDSMIVQEIDTSGID